MSYYDIKLPVYIMADCSCSMSGEPIQAVIQGIKALILDFENDPQAYDTVCLSLIVFDSFTRIMIPMTEIDDFKQPVLQIGGISNFGSALNFLNNYIKKESEDTQKYYNKYFKPVIFIITDGMFTDNWRKNLNILKEIEFSNIIMCGAGSNVNENNLKEITENVVMMNNLTMGDLLKFLKWENY